MKIAIECLFVGSPESEAASVRLAVSEAFACLFVDLEAGSGHNVFHTVQTLIRGRAVLASAVASLVSLVLFLSATARALFESDFFAALFVLFAARRRIARRAIIFAATRRFVTVATLLVFVALSFLKVGVIHALLCNHLRIKNVKTSSKSYSQNLTRPAKATSPIQSFIVPVKTNKFGKLMTGLIYNISTRAPFVVNTSNTTSDRQRKLSQPPNHRYL